MKKKSLSMIRHLLSNKNFQDITQAIGPSRYQKLRELMAVRIQAELAKKLHGIEYIPMDMDYGIVPEKNEREEEPDQLTHGRKWQRFNQQELLPLKKNYILSSPVGMGKTTFIYHLVGMLLEIGYLPLVCTCQEFEVVKPNTAIQLLIYLAEMHNQYSDRKFKQETIFNIFDSHHKKIIFLFDGLDQIKSNDYPYIVGAIEKNCYGYHYLITSRPSAVNHLESREEYVFLRLQMFLQKAVSAFLGKHYKSARDLTSFAPDLIRTPMLAYMVKELLEEEPERDIQTRTELYQAFVSYIVREHNKEEYQFTKAMNIKKNLQKISYTALVLENPQIQKISLEHCYAQLENMICEDLTTYGFVYLALEKSDFLYFTHQSFQEYFAACYVKEHPKYIDKVIIQMWHPKWSEYKVISI